MDSPQTLHNFVLNLLSDPAARSAFELDPERVLQDAGLADITAADVHDVIPLVADYVPVHGAAGLDVNLDDTVGALGTIDADPAAAIRQLQSVTHQISVSATPTSVDLNAAAIGAISVDPSGLDLTVAPGILSGITGGVAVETGLSSDLSEVNDLANTLDSDLLGTTTGQVTSLPGDVLAGTTAEGLLGTVDVTTNTVTSGLGGSGDLLGSLDLGGVTDIGGLTDIGGVADGLTGTLGSTGSALPDVQHVGDTVQFLDGTVQHATNLVPGLGDTVSQTGLGNLLGGGSGAHADASVDSHGLLGDVLF